MPAANKMIKLIRPFICFVFVFGPLFGCSPTPKPTADQITIKELQAELRETQQKLEIEKAARGVEKKESDARVTRSQPKKRFEQCIACQGSGFERCFACKGTGTKTCDRCNGRGQFTDLTGKPVNCVECDGAKTLRCTCYLGRGPQCKVCEGTGKVVVE